jgi:hypothetical protein
MSIDKISIDEEWYTLDSIKQIRNIEHIMERQDELCKKMDKIELVLTSILQRLEHTEKRNQKDTITVANALHELHTIKEREINLLLREHIPFPFKLPIVQSSTPNSILYRRPFSNKKIIVDE